MTQTGSRSGTHVAFGALLDELAMAFVRVPADAIDREIGQWLQRIVEFFDADRSTIAQQLHEGMRTTHSWARPGYELPIGLIAEKDLPWLLAKVRGGETLMLTQLDDIPPEAVSDRRIFERLQLKSQVTVPLVVAGTPVGLIGIGFIRRRRALTGEILQRIRLIGTVFGNAFARQRASLEYRELGQVLAHAGRIGAMGQLAASLAHELSQPLGASLTNAQSALQLAALPQPDIAEVRAALTDIAADIRRAGDIVRELRGHLRKQAPNVATLAVPEVIATVARFVASEARNRDIEVELNLGSELPAVDADRVQIQQVLVNLLLNAFDSLGAVPAAIRRVIICAAAAPAGRVVISVADNGAGVPSDLCEHLFEPFVSTKLEGLGLGLAIAQGIAVAHGGPLIYSPRDGGGSVFSFTLAMAGVTTHGG